MEKHLWLHCVSTSRGIRHVTQAFNSPFATPHETQAPYCQALCTALTTQRQQLTGFSPQYFSNSTSRLQFYSWICYSLISKGLPLQYMLPLCFNWSFLTTKSALLVNTPGSQGSTLLAIDFHTNRWTKDGELAQQVKALATRPYDDLNSISRTHIVEVESYPLTPYACLQKLRTYK